MSCLFQQKKKNIYVMSENQLTNFKSYYMLCYNPKPCLNSVYDSKHGEHQNFAVSESLVGHGCFDVY